MSPSQTYTDRRADQIKTFGETVLIQKIRKWLAEVSPAAPNGIGDDCAVLKTVTDGRQLITTDAVTYGIHFDDSISAYDAGAKLIKRNLSDIAAMGGAPADAVLALMCSPRVSIHWLKAFFSGIRETSQQYEVQIVGGDISAIPGDGFSAVLTLTGHTQRPLLRSTAQIGDSIYVTGRLGGSLLGKHYAFEPRLAEGQWLAKQMTVSAMMDLTDGLAKDLPQLLPEASQAHLRVDSIPLAVDAHRLASSSGKTAIEHAFCDGEDYELLFILSKNADRILFEQKWSEQFADLSVSCIGEIHRASSQAALIDARDKSPFPWRTGFEHLNNP